MYYFDYAATTPTDPEVTRAMEPYFFEKFGNASSPHSVGQEALKVLEESRETLARFIGASPQEIIFNSGATEGNNHAIFGVAQKLKDKGRHIIISKVEHHSVLEPVNYLKSQGFDVTYLDVDENGRINPADVKEAITDQTILVAVIHANNEIGTIQPIEEVGAITKEKGVIFCVDACQTVGHIPVNVNILNCDLLTFSAHKCYGPKGVGTMYIRSGTLIGRIMMGGDQERDRRASTQNVAGAVGLAKAVELCEQKMDAEAKQQIQWRDQLLDHIPKIIHGVKVNGHHQHRLPNNIHFCFEGIKGQSLLIQLDENGFAASMGSACTTGVIEPSHVLTAIGVDDTLADSALRLTLGRWTTQEHIDQLIEKLPTIVNGLRK